MGDLANCRGEQSHAIKVPDSIMDMWFNKTWFDTVTDAVSDKELNECTDCDQTAFNYYTKLLYMLYMLQVNIKCSKDL